VKSRCENGRFNTPRATLRLRIEVATCLAPDVGSAHMRHLLLFADTLQPNASKVHEIRFKHPVHVHGFRIVGDGERPHTELSFEGRTSPEIVKIELFGCEHGSGAVLCTSLLTEPHRHQVGPSMVHELVPSAANARINYLVVR
jgi:hypothetical protein